MKPVHVAILALVFTAACGTQVRDKDARNNSSENNQNNDPNNTTGTNNSSNNTSNNANNGSNNSNNPVNNPPNNVNNPPNNANNPPNNANNPPNNVNNPPNNVNNPPNNVNNPPNNTTCVWDNTFFGQIGGLDEHGGGVPTPAALTGNTGLGEVLAQVPPTPDDFNTIDVDEGYVLLANPIFVSGATVTATGPNFAGNRRFWLEDVNGVVQVFLPLELPFTIRVGDQVEFSATALQNFEGHPQVADLTGFFILSSGNAVPYRDVNNRGLNADDYGHIVRLAGTLGAAYDCGGTNCYDFTYPGGTGTLRSRSTIAVRGSCVQFAGPLYSFPGPFQTAMVPNLQMDTINFDWMWIQ